MVATRTDGPAPKGAIIEVPVTVEDIDDVDDALPEGDEGSDVLPDEDEFEEGDA